MPRTSKPFAAERDPLFYAKQTVEHFGHLISMDEVERFHKTLHHLWEMKPEDFSEPKGPQVRMHQRSGFWTANRAAVRGFIRYTLLDHPAFQDIAQHWGGDKMTWSTGPLDEASDRLNHLQEAATAGIDWGQD